MNQVAAIAIQSMGVAVAILGTLVGLNTEHSVFGAAAVALGIAAFFSKSGRYRSPK